MGIEGKLKRISFYTHYLFCQMSNHGFASHDEVVGNYRRSIE